MDTLAFGYILPTTGRIRDFNPLETCDARRTIITTGLAGGLLTPYKGLLPALESKDSSNGSPAATSFTY